MFILKGIGASSVLPLLAMQPELGLGATGNMMAMGAGMGGQIAGMDEGARQIATGKYDPSNIALQTALGASTGLLPAGGKIMHGMLNSSRSLSPSVTAIIGGMLPGGNHLLHALEGYLGGSMAKGTSAAIANSPLAQRAIMTGAGTANSMARQGSNGDLLKLLSQGAPTDENVSPGG